MTTLNFHHRKMLIADELMEKLLKTSRRAAMADSSVLLCGESGTGKELIARYIHEISNRREMPFISVNCAAIPEGLMEAELFGYEKGAFTGALAQRIGKFERAQGGTLLLDEVSEMSLPLQAKLLRVLQESEIDRLGGKGPIRINTRIIATTNKDPFELISKGLFREDLYYRLNVFRIECHPLRERREAIRKLSQFFLENLRERYELLNQTFSAEALEKLDKHSWPGNIRELANAIERTALMTEEALIGPEHISFLRSHPRPVEMETVSEESLAALEKRHIEKMLEKVDGNRTEAARKLGISVRTLRNKLKEYQAPS